MNRTMFTFSFIVCGLLAVLVSSCVQYPTELGYIDPGKVQTIGFTFTNTTTHVASAEGAPGDTLHLAASFAGADVHSYTCSLSTQYTTTTYGSDTATGFVAVSDPGDTVLPHFVGLTFVIPPDFFNRNTDMITRALSAIPDSQKALIPSGSNAQQLVAFASQLLSQTDFSTVDSATQKMAAQLADLLTGKIVLHIHINGGYLITRTIAVNYNTHVKNNPFVYINTNPVPYWIGVYKIKNRSSLSSFTPQNMEATDTLICIYRKDSIVMSAPVRYTDTILIDTGYTYYMAADSGIITRTVNGIQTTDTLLEKGISYNGTPGREQYNYLWFCQADTAEARGTNAQNVMIISNGAYYFTAIAPPLETNIVHETVWLRLSDSFPNTFNRSIGVSVTNVNMVLTYTDRYKNSAKKK